MRTIDELYTLLRYGAISLEEIEIMDEQGLIIY